MKTKSLKRALWKISFLAVTSLSVIGLSADALAQSRGGARRAGVGGVRPVGGIVRPTRDIIMVPGGRRGTIDDFPMPTSRIRRVPDVERTRRHENERREHERRPHLDDGRQEETREPETIRHHDNEANRFQKLGRWLGVSPERLQSFFQEAKAANPDLRLSQFFSAMVLSNRLNDSFPNVKPQAILRGLDSGMSLERTLVALGLSAEEAKAAVNWAERVVKYLKP